MRSGLFPRRGGGLARSPLVRALLVLLAAAPMLGAICVSSGAWEVAATPDGSLIVFDSARLLFRSDDDGATWYATDSLPLESTRMSQEAAAGGGRYRIRTDGLGVEEELAEGWVTAWEYPPDRVEFGARQLPGPCGDGHGELRLTGMMPGPDGSGWTLLVTAGPDGLMGLDDDGVWTRGVFGDAASLEVAPAQLDLLPEATLLGLATLAGVIALAVLDFRRDTRKYLLAALGWGGALVVWWAAHRTGERSFVTLAGYASLPVLAMLVACRKFRCDVAEVFLGGFFGLAVGAGVVAVGSSHDSTSWGITLAAIAGMLIVVSGVGIRGQNGRPPLVPATVVKVAIPIGLAALAAYQPFRLWAAGDITAKRSADFLASGIAAVGVLVAWWWSRRGSLNGKDDPARG